MEWLVKWVINNKMMSKTTKKFILVKLFYYMPTHGIYILKFCNNYLSKIVKFPIQYNNYKNTCINLQVLMTLMLL